MKDSKHSQILLQSSDECKVNVETILKEMGQISLILTINPEQKFLEQTMKTLNFSLDAGAIKTIIQNSQFIQKKEQCDQVKETKEITERMQRKLDEKESQYQELLQKFEISEQLLQAKQQEINEKEQQNQNLLQQLANKQQELLDKQLEIVSLFQENMRFQNRDKQIKEENNQPKQEQPQQLVKQANKSQVQNSSKKEIEKNLGQYVEIKQGQLSKQKRNKKISQLRDNSQQQMKQEKDEEEAKDEQKFDINEIDKLFNHIKVITKIERYQMPIISDEQDPQKILQYLFCKFNFTIDGLIILRANNKSLIIVHYNQKISLYTPKIEQLKQDGYVLLKVGLDQETISDIIKSPICQVCRIFGNFLRKKLNFPEHRDYSIEAKIIEINYYDLDEQSIKQNLDQITKFESEWLVQKKHTIIIQRNQNEMKIVFCLKDKATFADCIYFQESYQGKKQIKILEATLTQVDIQAYYKQNYGGIYYIMANNKLEQYNIDRWVINIFGGDGQEQIDIYKNATEIEQQKYI